MSKTKEHYHEEICKGLHNALDEDYHYDKWSEYQKALEDAHYNKLAEEAEFISIFQNTGTYPM